MSINRYLNIDSAMSSSATVFTLTQIATLNYQLTGISIQLNPDNGAITLRSSIDDLSCIDEDTLKQRGSALLHAAEAQYETLREALTIGQY